MDEQLRRLQLTQLEMLKLIDNICRENDITYSLYAGTLLGAVRHQGFIPWDDDLDVCMSRDNYERFLDVWEKTEHPGYLLQNKDNAPAFSQSFSKIRKDHTTFLHSVEEAGRYHTGIFVDIFPFDRMPATRLRKLAFYWDCMRYQLYTREFVPQQYGLVQKWGAALLLALTPSPKRPKLRKKLLARITANNDNHSLEVVGIETLASMRKHYANDLLDFYTTLPFEDGEFMCFAGWEEHLRRKFGDYMTLPPESERTWKHHPVCIDFEHNYDEIERV